MRSGAGKADLAVKILTLKGTAVPFKMNSSSDRDSVSYTPKEPGIHSIYVTFGGVDVPGTFLPIIADNTKLVLVFPVKINPHNGYLRGVPGLNLPNKFIPVIKLKNA